MKEHYYTPEIITESLFNLGFFDGLFNNILEPCAGMGAIVKVLKEYYPVVTITAVEINGSFRDHLLSYCDHVYIDNFMDWPSIHKFDRIIINPPFHSTTEFILKSLQLLSENGKVAVLVPLVQLCGIKRYNQLYSKYKPTSVNIFVRRTTNDDMKGINVTGYGWVIWDYSVDSSVTQLNWIEP